MALIDIRFKREGEDLSELLEDLKNFAANVENEILSLIDDINNEDDLGSTVYLEDIHAKLEVEVDCG